MLRSLYSAAAGLLATNLEDGVVADNLANSETAGYKQRQATLGTFATMAVQRAQPFATALGTLGGTTYQPLAPLASGALVNQTATDWSTGPLQHSSNPLAAAINGPGFFAVSTAQGVRYTRGGDFRFSASGGLTDAYGDPVLDAAGRPIVAPGGQSRGPATLQAGGQVAIAGTVVGTIGVFAAPTAALSPVGNGLYALAAGTPAPGAQPGATLQPGFVEGSNVDLIGQMAALLQIQQAFATDSQAVQTAGTTLNIGITQVGTVS